MKWVSLLGLVVLLAIAWGISFHRKKVQMRPIFWGLGLQFLFAVIILKGDDYSFAGMAVFGGLLISYMVHQEAENANNKYVYTAGFLGLGAAIAGLAFFAFSSLLLGIGISLLILFAVLNSKWKWAPKAGPLIGTGVISLGFIFLLKNNLHGQELFRHFSDGVAFFLTMSDYGAMFLFANLADGQHFFPESGTWPGFGFQFAFKVLPTIIFFGGFMSVLYYLGIMQKLIETLSRFMRWTIGTSGAETLSCSANIFVGQTEAPLMIKPFLDKMTKSELLTIMVGGFATIAGGVLAGYIAMGVSAGHLIAASVMSAPAALVIGKIIYPETETSATAGDVALPKLDTSSNMVEAATAGISDGLKLAVNVGAMLVGFISLIAVLDLMLNYMDKLIDGHLLGGELYNYPITGLSPAVSEYAGYFPGSLQTLFGYLLAPLAWVMGVPPEDIKTVGNLLGVKLSLNEFVAFGSLGVYIQQEALTPRGAAIATYALCGFANFSSVGIQIGGLSALAPERRKDLAKVGLRAMFGGALASWTTATVAGIFWEGG